MDDDFSGFAASSHSGGLLKHKATAADSGIAACDWRANIRVTRGKARLR